MFINPNFFGILRAVKRACTHLYVYMLKVSCFVFMKGCETFTTV